MALADPQSIKIDESTAVSLPRVSTGDFKSVYTSSDGTIDLRISTEEKSRKRQVARVDVSKITADPFIPAQNSEVSMSAYLVVDRPPAGFTNEEAKKICKGLFELLTASTDKNLKAFLGSES